MSRCQGSTPTLTSRQGGRPRLSEVVVGVDVGTTLIKAAAFDQVGQVVALVQAATASETPRPGWAEVEMEGLWRQVAAALRELAGRLGGGHPVRAIGISAFMGGAWLVDRDGRPVRNAIAWHDARAVTVLDELRATGLLDRSFGVSCNALTPGFALVVLRWLRDHEPAVLERARTLLFAKDWIRFRLTGEVATDGSDASHAPGDAQQRTFSPCLMEQWGLGELKALLPPVLPSGAVAGRVTEAAAGDTGMPAGTPVITGLADVSAALVGGGVVAPGQAGTILGSSCLNSVVTERPVWDPAGVGLSFLIPPDRWTRTMPNQTGTLALDWFRRNFDAGGPDAGRGRGGRGGAARRPRRAVSSLPERYRGAGAGVRAARGGAGCRDWGWSTRAGTSCVPSTRGWRSQWRTASSCCRRSRNRLSCWGEGRTVRRGGGSRPTSPAAPLRQRAPRSRGPWGWRCWPG